MLLALKIAQIIISLFMIGLVLIQSKGIGLSGAFGGGGEVYFARRGAEKALFIFTVLLAVVFIVVSTLNVWFN